MDYRKIYFNLIEKANKRQIDGYFEVHHIIPRCMNGGDESHNLVKLTPEEHYLAHQLLTKIYPDNQKLIKAAVMMIPNRPSNKLYGWLKRKYSVIMSESQTGHNNSQYNTMWINNGIESKKIKIMNEIPFGWTKGRLKKPKQKLPSKKDLTKQKDISDYTEYYKIYCDYGWDTFVEITNYRYSKQNFVTRCSRLLPEFVPQNGKKRGK